MSLFKRRKPWVTLQYDEQFIPENFSEQGVETGAKFERHLATNHDLKVIFKATKGMDVKETEQWLASHIHRRRQLA